MLFAGCVVTQQPVRNHLCILGNHRGVTIVWMQDEKQLPVETNHCLNTLNSYRTAFETAAKRASNRPIPQNATYEQLHHAWCAQSLAAAAGVRPYARGGLEREG